MRMRVLDRLLACRTEELGGHLCVCAGCGYSAVAYNSCGDRHCPQCQGRATADWVETRRRRMLPTPHFQVVFTLPAQLRSIAMGNPRLVYNLLFQVGTSILKDLAAQRMGARLGITSVLHTWTTELSYHPHVHCLVTSGGLSLDDERWVESGKDYLFPGRVLGQMFRGRFLERLIDLFEAGDLYLPGDQVEAAKAFRTTVRSLSKRHTRWVVHVEAPRGRPVEYVTKYLARYVKRVAISDARIVEVTQTHVSFRTKDGSVVTLEGAEFVRRYLLHVLPSRLPKVRHHGLYAPGNAKLRLETARRLFPGQRDAPAEPSAEEEETDQPPADARPTALDVCPACGEAQIYWIALDLLSLVQPRGPP